MIFLKQLVLAPVLALTVSIFSVNALAAESGHQAAPVANEHSATHKTDSTASHAGAEHGGDHGGGHATGIPMSVTFQTINFLIYIGLLLYFLRKPIVEFFKSREQVYKQSLVKAENARRDAEKKKREIQQRLRGLESTADESLDQARAEATALKLQIRQDAESLAERLRTEANRTAQLEVERAKTILREDLLKQSVELSRKLLFDKMADGDQKRLQTEFVDKIQEVR